MVQIAGHYDQNAEPSSGDFDPIPAGEYLAVIEQSEIAEVSSKSEKGRCLVLTWKITGEHFAGRLIWQRLNMWAENMNKLDKVISIANSQFAMVREATGKMNVADTDELLQIPCIIKVKVKTDPTGQYGPQNEITNVKPANAGPAARTAPASRGPAPTTRGPAPGKAPAAGGGNANPFAHLKSGAPAMADDEIPF
ncbi:DUF669 domain-containing protein [Hoeflea sp. G2-23]|uniref:DUF669 domain-containing protein n=1 Tax=Hoeflea algicola TaxID=2983763 RepID=A0ABT3ZGH3_9HYPH|nr:DUF669 domain-containing protein [Hoeflea algicola]MCY0150597.1 DUF669 domain-containing protein [Hoeflea algicola]MCY0150915.1 DUF669 domain-containing protein [Hoeflea algicola]